MSAAERNIVGLKVLAAVTIVAAIGLAILSWTIKPNPAIEAFTIVGLPLLWLGLRRSSGPADPVRAAARQRFLYIGLTGMAAYTMLDTGPELALYTGLVGDVWQPFVQRTQGIVWGLALAVLGNYMPKLWLVWSCGSDTADAAAQQRARFAGWTLALAGIAAVAIWTLLPEPTARIAMLTLSLGLVVVLLGRGVFSSATPAGGRQA